MPLIDLPPRDRLFYVDENRPAERAVLLMHGLGANTASWQLQIPELVQRGYRVIAVDAPGFGQSPYSGRHWSISGSAALIHQLLASLGINHLDVVGISMGGTMALQLTLDFPHHVKRLVLVNTFARLQLASPLVLPYFALRFLLVHTLGLPVQARQVAKRLFPLPEQEPLRQALIEQILQADPRAYRAAMRALARFNVYQRLPEIQAPTLVITGERDTTVPPANQHVLAAGIRAARQVTVPAAGHAVTVEKPAEFNHLLIDFLQ